MKVEPLNVTEMDSIEDTLSYLIYAFNQLVQEVRQLQAENAELRLAILLEGDEGGQDDA